MFPAMSVDNNGNVVCCSCSYDKQGYRFILAERRGTLSEQCNKLRNGLTKLEEAREQASAGGGDIQKNI